MSRNGGQYGKCADAWENPPSLLTVAPKRNDNSGMDAISDFLRRCDAYRLALNPPISRARLGAILFSDARKLNALDAGADIGVRRLERAIKDLAGLENARNHELGLDLA